MKYERNPELIDRLAAEYVLGTLRGAARLRFQRLAAEHAVVRNAIRDWETRLAPMAMAIPEVPPPRRVWQAVSSRIAQRGPAILAADRPVSAGFWNSLAFWRNWGLIATGCAAALVGAVIIREQNPVIVERVVEVPARNYVATLRDQTGNVALIAVAARDSRELQVRRLALPEAGADRALELWRLPADKDGKPASLGLIPAGEKGSIQLAATAINTLKGVPALAISVEPAGGSKTGQPTGPVLYSGPCVQFW